MNVLTDRFGRAFPYLRLSVIEACNYRCSYCLPDGFRAVPGRPESLQTDEIARLLRLRDMGGIVAIDFIDLYEAENRRTLHKALKDAMADDKIPKGRIRRSAKLGSAIGTQATRYAGTKAANVARSGEAADSRLEARHLETAVKMASVLGEMMRRSEAGEMSMSDALAAETAQIWMYRAH